jgi:hypothetical protein
MVAALVAFSNTCFSGGLVAPKTSLWGQNKNKVIKTYFNELN